MIDLFSVGIVGNAELGVLPLEQRGVEDLDQQWNAFNFVYYVERAEGSYERKYITNRLSFYIDPVHGSRIFPGNIESQLSKSIFPRLSNFSGAHGNLFLVVLPS